jgi:hypothetical protein
MKLALFRTPNSQKLAPGDELTEKYCDEWVRVTEWVEVDFPTLSLEARQAQLAKVEAARESARKYYEGTLERLNTQAEALQS